LAVTSSGTTIKPIVYRIDNLVDGKFYIGVSKAGILARRRGHRHAALKNTDKGRSKLYNAMRKHGEENFKFSIIEELETFELALAREVELIAELKPNYNIRSGGQKGNTGFKMPREIVERIAAQKRGSVGYWRGKKRPPETCEKFAAAKRGKPNLYCLGRPKTEEAKLKMSMAKRGIPRKPAPAHALAIFAENMRRAARARRKSVMCLDDGKIYESAQDASIAYGFNPTTVAGVAGGRRKKVYGLTFKYVEEIGLGQ